MLTERLSIASSQTAGKFQHARGIRESNCEVAILQKFENAQKQISAEDKKQSQVSFRNVSLTVPD